jgi:6-phosphogluconolactonase/glucosamine-6-phosphate isomerase/deaminase
MRIIKTTSMEEFNQVGVELLLTEMLKTDDRVNLAITAGTTPIGIYEQLVPRVKERAYLTNVHYYNFDEIPHKLSDDEGITMTDLRTLYFNPAQIAEEKIHKLDEKNYSTQDERIKVAGGLDAILLGIGADGHYCGNLPGTTKFSDLTTEVACDEKMKQRIGRLFNDENDVPESYVTMGPRSIMNAKHLILAACGAHKAEIIRTFLEGGVDEKIPASILKMHPNLTLLVDEEAGKWVK